MPVCMCVVCMSVYIPRATGEVVGKLTLMGCRQEHGNFVVF